MRAAAAAALAASLLLAGCGSTVRSAGGSLPGQEHGAGLSASGESVGTGGPATVPTHDGASSATGSTGTASRPARPLTHGAPPTAPDVTGVAVGRNGPGVTDDTVTLGFSYYRNADQANAAMGAGGIKASDPIAGMRVLIAEVNRRGGIAGRKVRTAEWSMDPQSTTPYSASGQQLCTAFTEDTKVFAVIDGAPAAGRAARACLAKRGVLYFGASILVDELVPGEIDLTSLTWSSLFRILPAQLGRQGWFGGWNHTTGSPASTPARVAILTVDSPGLSRAVDRVLLPAFRAAGHPVAAENVIRIAPPGGTADNGAVVAAVHSAVLRFRTSNVSHVVLTDSNGSMSLLFQNDALSQGYFPRYGGSTGNGWQALVDAGSIQASTLRGAMGISFQPLLDTHAPPESFGSSAARKACWAVFKAGGMASSTTFEAAGQAVACDIVFFLGTILHKHRGPLERAGTLALVDGLGTSYPAGSVMTRLTPSKHDGAAGYAVMTFDAGCSCFRYKGPIGSI